MGSSTLGCLIVTSAHHPEDGRIQRHLENLRGAGISADIWVAPPRSRLRRFLMAPLVVQAALRERWAAAVILPDPELFVFGSLAARFKRVRAVIDIHEDYPAVARDRDWAPRSLRGGLALLVRVYVWLGTKVASACVVAAGHLAGRGDHLVTNIPGLDLFPGGVAAPPTRAFVVYVGDVTGARGAMEMVETVSLVPDLRLELIGPVSDSLRAALRFRSEELGCADRVYLRGRLSYRESWQRAEGAVAGLALLRPTLAYRAATPTKLWEYAASGIPIVVSDLPAQSTMVAAAGSGAVVDSPQAAARVLQKWMDNPEEARAIGRRARAVYETEVAVSDNRGSLVAAIRPTDGQS